MTRLAWDLWWLFEWRALMPLAKRRRRLRIQVRAAVWCHQRRLYFLHNMIGRWWRVRNWWLERFWWTEPFANWRFHCLDWARPRCESCGKCLYSPLCHVCMLGDFVRRHRVARLTDGRQRYGERT